MRATVPPITVVGGQAIDTPTGVPIRPHLGLALDRFDPERSIVRITNTTTTGQAVTVKAGVFAFACLGDLTINVPPNGDVLLALDASRFRQRDGTTLLDFEPDHTGTVSLMQVARDVS